MTENKKSIAKLTPEQEAALPKYRDKWREVGLNTDPIDRQAAQDSVNELYDISKRKPPEIVWGRSPLECLNLRHQRSRGKGALWQEIFFMGAQESFWLAFYDFVESIGIEFPPDIKRHFEAHKRYARHCGWMYAYDKVAYVSDRISEVHFDAQGRLHNATGPAINHRDGFACYSWHGMRIPAKMIEERDKITPDSIGAEVNAEFRRVALEIYGYDRYLQERKARVIATDEIHGEQRRLLEVSVANQPVRILEVVNGTEEPDGTKRKFHLGAMPGSTDTHNAVARSYGFNPDRYKERQRT